MGFHWVSGGTTADGRTGGRADGRSRGPISIRALCVSFVEIRVEHGPGGQGTSTNFANGTGIGTNVWVETSLVDGIDHSSDPHRCQR